MHSIFYSASTFLANGELKLEYTTRVSYKNFLLGEETFATKHANVGGSGGTPPGKYFQT